VNFLIIFYLINATVTILCKTIWAVIKDHLTAKIARKYHAFVEKRKEKAKFYNSLETKLKLKNWFATNLDYPYPSSKTKSQLAVATGLSIQQVSKWFTNERYKFKKIREK